MALLALAALLILAFAGCSDDDSSAEFLFDREISDFSVLRECAKDADSGAYCFQVQFRYPITTEDLDRIYLWVDSTVVGDTAKAVSDDDLEKATASFEYEAGTTALFDTIDLTSYIKDYVEDRTTLMIAVYCHYSSGKPGTLQRLYLHFGDDIAPLFLPVTGADSVWTNGALFEWSRPTDQTDFYKPLELSGTILGYNFILFSEDSTEDLRNVKVTVFSPDGVDSTGDQIYTRHARIKSNTDSVWTDAVAHGDNVKNYLRIMIKDRKGYNVDYPDSNRFRLVIEGLKTESRYTVGSSAWDSAGNSAGNENVDPNKRAFFTTTDSVAPLMPTKLYTLKDTLFPSMTRLDSNNRLRLFWSRGVDPYKRDNGIRSDTLLLIPDSCGYRFCYDTVASYMVEYYDRLQDKWTAYANVGGAKPYAPLYEFSGDTMKVSATGSLVTDTVRWVAPGDTLILRIRAIDKSGYYSAPLIDTVYVSPGALAKEIDCPGGFVPVKASDTSLFCMERVEHRDGSGRFMNNVLHSEALATCEAMSADGFRVSLCNERDWELVCLSGGTLPYGVIQEDSLEAAKFLFVHCNVSTDDSSMALDYTKRVSQCMNPMGVRDLPGQLQEWVMGRSEDSAAVLKGGSYKVFSGLDRESIALCTNRSFPFFTRLAYTKDTVYLYREGAKVDTAYAADTSRTLYRILTQKDFRDTLQFFDVQDADGNSVGQDYAPYSEFRKGGEKWLEQVGNGMKYVPDHIEIVFLTGEKVAFRGAANFYKSPGIGFRCCAYKE